MPIPVDESQLVPSDTFGQQNFIDFNTRLPATGKLYFFKASSITEPKEAYVRTGDSMSPYAAVIDLPLDNSGSVPLFFFYPRSEIDGTVQELYYVEVRTNEGALIYSETALPPQEGKTSGGGIVNPTQQADGQNFCPSFGFESPLHNDLFIINNGNPIQEQGMKKGDLGFYLSWGWEYGIENIANSQEYFHFNQLGISNIPGNPANKLIINSTLNGPNNTYKRLGFTLGSYSDLQSVSLLFSVVWNWGATSAGDEIEFFITRGPQNPALFTPISVGTLPIDTIETRNTFSFVVPALTASNFSPTDKLYFYGSLPAVADFEIQLTATWCQVGNSSGDLHIFPPSQGEKNAHLFYSSRADVGFSSEGYNRQKLPLAFDGGELTTVNTTGEIILVAAGATPRNDSLPFDGSTYYSQDIVLQTNTPVSRFLPIFQKAPQTNGRTIYTSARSDNSVSFILNFGNFSEDWDITESPTLDVLKTVGSRPYEMIAAATNSTTLRLTYSYNVVNEVGGPDDNKWIFQDQANPNVDVPLPFINGCKNNPIRNWFEDNQKTDPSVFNKYAYGNGLVSSTIVQNGSITVPIIQDFVFNLGSADQFTSSPSEGYVYQDSFKKWSSFRHSNLISWNGSHGTGRMQRLYYGNFKNWGPELTENFSDSLPDYIINFTDSLTTLNSLQKGRVNTIYLDVSGMNSQQDVIDTLAGIINSGTSDTFKITSTTVPITGQYLIFSNDKHKFACVFQREGEPLPALNIPGVERILYMRYPSATVVKDFITFLSTAITEFIGYVPTEAEASLNIFPGGYVRVFFKV